jgi:hypothetical protein
MLQYNPNAVQLPADLCLLLQLLPTVGDQRTVSRRCTLECIKGLSEPDQINLSLDVREPMLVDLTLNAFESVPRQTPACCTTSLAQ